MNEVTFNITVTMNKRWVSHFLSFLKRMETDGAIGHSEKIVFYADGDGDFHPIFNIQDDVVWTNKKGQLKEFNEKMHIFDAG